MERERVELVVSGRVQGVGFRYATYQRAAALGLTGWVRNRPDRRVEVIAEGPRAALMDLVAFCNAGPPFARVDDVDTRWLPADGLLGPFEVRR